MAKQWKAHCVVLAYPIQGHINPMLQFSKRLQYHQVKATFVTTRSFWNTIPTEPISYNSISLESISDGYDDKEVTEAAKNPVAHVERFWKVGPQTLSQLLQKLSNNNDGVPVDCVIYDTFLPWAFDVAKKFGLISAAFFTQSCAVNSIYFHLHQGMLKLPLTESKILLPGIPELEPSDLPSFLYLHGTYPFFWHILVDPLSTIGKADWILSNTIYELEPKVVNWMGKIWPLRTIGPTVPSMFLDKRIQGDDDYGISMFKPSSDLCMKWLQDKPKGSVIYVSFGSLASLSKKQMEELAGGLIDSESYFLWVVRTSEEAKLPKNFMEITSKKGLLVTWCPQLQVLSHEAVGCFVTHCGWNSTLEAVSLGIPMIVVPQWTDQSTNAKHIVDIWKIGVKASVDEKGILGRETLTHCIKEVMESGKGNEIRDNAIKWRELTRNSIDEGGSSDLNIREFVEKIAH